MNNLSLVFVFIHFSAIHKRNGTWQGTYYVLTDNIGSVNVVTDQWGNITNRYYYTPWGGRTRIKGNVDITDRGYTGHEHLTALGLINMNGRIYDPVLARFLSPDPYVQAPDFTQNYNRYSYCLNNPFKYTDPSGEWLHIAMGAVIGGFTNLIINTLNNKVDNPWQALAYFGIGAAAGALTAASAGGASSLLAGGSFGARFIGSSTALTAGTSFLNGAAIAGTGGLTGGLINGFGNGLMQGQKFGQALVQGAIHGLIGATIGGITGGLVGGISAAIDHRNFWDGSKVINTEVLADANLPATIQEGPFDCGYANAQANTGISQVEYKNKAIELMKQYPKLYSEKGVKPKLLKLAIEDLTGKQVMIYNDKFPTSIAEIQSYKMWLNQGNRFIFSSGTGTSINHATSLNKVLLQTIQKLSGSTFQRVAYEVMDTSNGTFKTILSKAMRVEWILQIFPK